MIERGEQGAPALLRQSKISILDSNYSSQFSRTSSSTAITIGIQLRGVMIPPFVIDYLNRKKSAHDLSVSKGSLKQLEERRSKFFNSFDAPACFWKKPFDMLILNADAINFRPQPLRSSDRHFTGMEFLRPAIGDN